MPTIKFINTLTDETLTHEEFVTLVWEETKRQFEDNNTEENWSDITISEQIELYCNQYEHQIQYMNWKQV